jgi:hypothetical protein
LREEKYQDSRDTGKKQLYYGIYGSHIVTMVGTMVLLKNYQDYVSYLQRRRKKWCIGSVIELIFIRT